MSLTMEEFRRLPRAERNKRYAELSPHEKFIARMEDWGAPDDAPSISKEDFLAHPPKGWEFLSKEVLDKMFPDDKANTD